MYKTNPSKIHLSTVIGFDVENKTYLINDERTFDTERELVNFLADYNYPSYNLSGNPIKGRYKNKYLDSQALNGLLRKSRCGDSAYDEVMHTLYPYSTSDLCYESVNTEWKVNNYLFWVDAPGQPNYDVRNLRDKVDAEYLRQLTIGSKRQRCFRFNIRNKKQDRSRHKCYPWRDDAKYIQRARAAYGMEAEEEYKKYVKAKDKAFKSIWPDEDFGGYHSTGWKDNSGNHYRHQWEAKAKRNFEKTKRKKDVAIFSGKKGEYKKIRRTKEELEAEVEMLRKEFGY